VKEEPMGERVKVLIASSLQAEYVERIREAEPQRIEVLYAPELLPIPRYENDHGGAARELNDDDLRRWRSLLAEAEVSFDFDWHDPAHLIENAPRLRWVQGTSAGLAGYVGRYKIPADRLDLTTAAGVHAQPLAEFALLCMLYFSKGMPALRERQLAHHWERFSGRELAGSTALVLGLGAIGRRTAQLAAGIGVHVIGTRRSASREQIDGVERIVGNDELDDVLPEADFVVISLPGTPQTRHLIDVRRIASMKDGAVLINIGRGAVVDEQALVEGLRRGTPGGAGLDVFETEPLPEESPLWDMPNVIVTPHSMSTVAQENSRIVDLFIDNLRRYLDGRPLRNRFSFEHGY
jgi:phosphoglycerate dehydrogenase-like enzyme